MSTKIDPNIFIGAAVSIHSGEASYCCNAITYQTYKHSAIVHQDFFHKLFKPRFCSYGWPYMDHDIDGKNIMAEAGRGKPFHTSNMLLKAQKLCRQRRIIALLLAYEIAKDMNKDHRKKRKIKY